MKDYAEIVFVLDRSSSMESIRDKTIESCNAFITDQQQVPGEATLTFVLFNQEVAICPTMNLRDADMMTRETYQPGGMTALLDAIGEAIDNIGKSLANKPEEERPSKVIFAILTDGEENSSHKYTNSQVASMIQHQQDVYGWQFFFLGANIDAFAVAQGLSISPLNTTQFDATNEGIIAANAANSRMVTLARTGT